MRGLTRVAGIAGEGEGVCVSGDRVQVGVPAGWSGSGRGRGIWMLYQRCGYAWLNEA